MVKKRVSISDKTISRTESDMDTLFGNTMKNNNMDQNDINTKEKELNHYNPIKDYYENHEFEKSNQYSIYLPKEIQQELKQKAVLNSKSISDLLMNAIANEILTKDELINAYRRGYKERNN